MSDDTIVFSRSNEGLWRVSAAGGIPQRITTPRMVAFHLLDGAGHWVQQEQPEQVSARLIEFLRTYASRTVDLLPKYG